MSEIDSLFKYNCSTLFLLFPLGLDRRKLMDFGFQSAYDGDKTLEAPYEYPVFLLFKPTDLTLFQAFVDSEYMRINHHTQTFDLKEDYDHEEGYVVLLYDFPDIFQDDYKRFLEGKYSKFSSKFRATYPKVIKILHENGRIDEVIGTAYKIINKNDPKLYEEVKKRGELDMREELEDRFDTIFTPDMELWETPSDKDILDINKILENDTSKKSPRRSKEKKADS